MRFSLCERLNGILAGAILQRKSVEVEAATDIVYYRQHMAREEADLFPRLKDILSSADWKAVNDAITAEADPLFGSEAWFVLQAAGMAPGVAKLVRPV